LLAVLLDALARAGERQIDGFPAQLGDRAIALALDLSARAIEHVLLLLARVLQHVGAQLFADPSTAGEYLLRLAAGGFDLRLMLLQQLRGRFTVTLGRFDRLFERLLARLRGGRDRPGQRT